MERRGTTILQIGDRASRFPVDMPMRYRPIGDVGWNEGRTLNLSRSGVLFEAGDNLAPDTPIEMSFDLPTEFGGGPGTQVICRGQVVRTLLPPATDAAPSVAASFGELRTLRD